MKMPRLLLGLTLLLWGYMFGQLWLGVLAGVLVELPRLWPGFRLAIGLRERRIAARASLALVLGILAYGVLQASRLDPGVALLFASACLPLAALPVLLAQRWGEDEGGEGFDLGLLLGAGRFARVVDLAWPVWALSLIAASVMPGSAGKAWFYTALCGLVIWALWGCRETRLPRWRWALAVLLAAGLGWGAWLGLGRMQGELEDHFGEWFMGMESGGEADPYRSETAMGRIGELKLSEKIVLRLRSDKPLRLPLRLRDVAYDTAAPPSWLARNAPFQPLTLSGTLWRLSGEAPEGALRLRLSHSSKAGKGLLLLPPGAIGVEGLAAARLERNRLGSLSVSEGPARLDYSVLYLPQGRVQADEPGPRDLKLPPPLVKLFEAQVEALGLKGLPEEARIARIRRHFEENFRYSLVQREAGASPLSDFLLRTRAGHCEYFASATVLLLRQAGIPARYATGYSVQEYSPWEGAYLVRARHAHAWAQAFVAGRWIDVDTTPARWADFEAERRPFWQPVLDVANWLLDRFSAWRAEDTQTGLSLAWAWLLAPVLAWFAWRLCRRWPARASTEKPRARQGLDSPWFEFERRMAQAGLIRGEAETPQAWLARLAATLPEQEAEQLAQALALHYRYRFDPQGLDPEGLRRMRERLRRDK